MNLILPKQVMYILNRLYSHGYEGFVVGGCVRDSLLGKKPKDWDITTNCLPNDTVVLFNDFSVIETGLKHGTVTVVIDGENYEITTYRVDGEYTDNRRPDSVNFTSSLYEDLSRRDFTINSLAYNPTDGLKDYFGGSEDLKKFVLKAVGNPDKRFEEDALRIMRALRFSSVLGLEIEEETAKSILKNKENLLYVSNERLNVEFTKLIGGKNAFNVLNDYRSVLSVFIPEIKSMFDFEQNNKHHIYDVYTHTLHVLKEAYNYNTLVQLAAFFHDIGKPFTYTQDAEGEGHFYGHASLSSEMTEQIMRRLKFSNEEVEKVCELVSNHDRVYTPSKKVLRKIANKLGLEGAENLGYLRLCDYKGHAGEGSETDSKIVLEALELLPSLYSVEECFDRKSLKVNGYDIMSLGYKGTEIGDKLELLLNAVMEEEVLNEKEALLKYLGN